MDGKLELVRKRTVLNAVRSYSCVSNGRGLVVKQSIAAGTVVIALGKLAVITEVKNTEQVSVRINDTGETKIVAVADVEIIPEEQETITQLTTYDPADPKEAMKLIAAAEQAVILKEYFNGDITQNEAAQKLSLKKSAFYKLASRFRRFSR
jgi:putative transposase